MDAAPGGDGRRCRARDVCMMVRCLTAFASERSSERIVQLNDRQSPPVRTALGWYTRPSPVSSLCLSPLGADRIVSGAVSPAGARVRRGEVPGVGRIVR